MKNNNIKRVFIEDTEICLLFTIVSTYCVFCVQAIKYSHNIFYSRKKVYLYIQNLNNLKNFFSAKLFKSFYSMPHVFGSDVA